MKNIDAVNALITAINQDRFADIQARHAPDATFWSFRGPTMRDAVGIFDWHQTFLRDYADCNYTNLEYIEDGDTVAVHATIEAKGYDWRPFTQNVAEVFQFAGDQVAERRLYATVPDLELDKPATAALGAAAAAKGGSASATRAALTAITAAIVEGNAEGAQAVLHDKAVIIDAVAGSAVGPEAVAAKVAALSRPVFGRWLVTATFAGAKDGLVELAVDPNRPRVAVWVRMADGKAVVIEVFWMLREIGVAPGIQKRPERRVIQPI